jgi:hypothetical protein
LNKITHGKKKTKQKKQAIKQASMILLPAQNSKFRFFVHRICILYIGLVILYISGKKSKDHRKYDIMQDASPVFSDKMKAKIFSDINKNNCSDSPCP